MFVDSRVKESVDLRAGRMNWSSVPKLERVGDGDGEGEAFHKLCKSV